MKPDPDVSGVPFNFDLIPISFYPDVWDETKQIRLRGLWFVLLYLLSFLVFGAIFLFPLALIFGKPMLTMTWVWLFLCVPGGIVLGFLSWWDFTRRRKQLLEEARKKSEVQSKETPPD